MSTPRRIVSCRNSVRNGCDGLPVGSRVPKSRLHGRPDQLERASSSPWRAMACAQAVGEPLALAVQVLDHRLGLVDLHRRDRRGQRVGLGAVGRGQQEHASSRVSRPPSRMNSRLPASADSAKPLAMRLAEGRQIRRDAVELLRAAHVPAEAGDHLVEDQQRAVRRGRAACSLGEEARRPARRCARAPGSRAAILPGCASNRARSAVEVVVAEPHGRLVALRGMPPSHRASCR